LEINMSSSSSCILGFADERSGHFGGSRSTDSSAFGSPVSSGAIAFF